MKYQWEKDDIQIPRLLAEISSIGLSNEQYAELMIKMDLRQYEIDQLLNRAEMRWERLKEKIIFEK